jgi:hypothetical protein
MTLRKKHRTLLAAIYTDPLPGNIKWRDIESLFEACGATMTEGKGSRIRVFLNGRRAVFHRPHPEPVTGKGQLRAVRDFLDAAGVRPE